MAQRIALDALLGKRYIDPITGAITCSTMSARSEQSQRRGAPASSTASRRLPLRGSCPTIWTPPKRRAGHPLARRLAAGGRQRGEHHRRPDHPGGGPIPLPQELGPQEDEDGHQAQPEQDLLVDPGADGGQKTLPRRDAGFLDAVPLPGAGASNRPLTPRLCRRRCYGPGRASDHGSGGGSAGSRRARRGAKRTLVSEVAALVCVLFAYR